ncbi:hypothetical protein EMCRGX_G006630 [Ephydatia muelleri]
MKQLARTAVYWPGMVSDITNVCHKCSTCAEHLNRPPKQVNHPWMLPEKPWSRIHLDHAINFLGSNWSFRLGAVRGITTNGAAERLIQTFKQGLVKSLLPPKTALQEFLMQYRRTPLSSGYSPSELLMGRLIRTRIDTLLPSPSHIAQGKQAREATKSKMNKNSCPVEKVDFIIEVGTPCYALYYGPRRDKDPRVTRRRHLEQLRPWHASQEDAEPGDAPVFSSGTSELGRAGGISESLPEPDITNTQKQRYRNPRLPTGARIKGRCYGVWSNQWDLEYREQEEAFRRYREDSQLATKENHENLKEENEALKKVKELYLREPLSAESSATLPEELCHHEKHLSGGAEQLELYKHQVYV